MGWLGLAWCSGCLLVALWGDAKMFIFGCLGIAFYFYTVEMDRTKAEKDNVKNLGTVAKPDKPNGNHKEGSPSNETQMHSGFGRRW